MQWPRISIVTPSYNQAAFLEQTILSVLEQGYPNLQYGVVDGGSTDGSVEIIERYRHRLDFTIIERDRGQCDAINKGLRRANGHILSWLNSDDQLLPGALSHVGEQFHNEAIDWLIGICRETDEQGVLAERFVPSGEFTLAGALIRDQHFSIPQPATFWRRQLTEKMGLLDLKLHYCMDFELWCRFLAAGFYPTLTSQELATYRLHEHSKTCAAPEQFIATLIKIEYRYAHQLPWRQRWRLHRKIGYQRRALCIRSGHRTLCRAVLQKPWWLGSQQVRQALWYGAHNHAA